MLTSDDAETTREKAIGCDKQHATSETPMRRLAGQTVIVYGASGPVGAGIALALGSEGANVVIHYHRNRAAAVNLAGRLEPAGGRVLVLSADVTNESQVRKLLDTAVAGLGSISAVVNCAHGPFEPHTIADSSWDDWRVHLDALQGHFVICKSVLPLMRRQRSGRIVFISGGLSLRLFPGFSAFSTVKAGLNAFSKTLAMEEGPNGITVNIVAPGKVDTDQSAESSAAWDDIEARQLSSAPLRRYASVADVAEAVIFFLSPAASGMTGQTLFVAAGEVMG
jgi:3-oxoacyl-[acyl-carrier protein] reductase